MRPVPPTPAAEGPSPAGGLSAWLGLFRAPNLLTVPGDPIAGFALAHFPAADADITWRIAPPAVAAVLLYMAGLVQNDLADLAEDRRERPARPLASGAVSVGSARVAMAALFVGGIATAALAGQWALLTAVVLAGLIFAYNRLLRRGSAFGLLAMGACRGASLLLGAAAAGLPLESGLESGSPVPTAAFGLAAYIVAVSFVARYETTRPALGEMGYLPLLAAMFWLVGMTHATNRTWLAALALLGLVIFQLGRTVWAFGEGLLSGDPSQTRRSDNIPAFIGRCIRLLLPIQAGLVLLSRWPFQGPFGSVYQWVLPPEMVERLQELALSPYGLIAAALLLAWPAAALLSRRFYAS